MPDGYGEESGRSPGRGHAGGRPPATGRERGVPDGLLVGILAFLLGMTLLVWSATGLAGLFSHGSWPTGVTFTHTPLAMRHLIGQPHDVAGAWPATPHGQLTGYGLFWGLLIGQLMVLFVLTVFVVGTVARWRARRASERAEAFHEGRQASGPTGSPEPAAGTGLGMEKTAEAPDRANASAAGAGAGAGSLDATGPVSRPTTADATTTAWAAAAGKAPAGAAQRGHTQPVMDTQAPLPADAQLPAHQSATQAQPEPQAGPRTPPQPQADEQAHAAGLPVVPAPLPSVSLPGPRRPLVLGSADTRRPLAVQAVRDAEGPVLVVTSDPDVWAETKDARAKLGPVLLYDPTHLCDTPARMHWSPSIGCEDRVTAAGRAKALLAPVRPSAKIDAAVADTAETLLRSFLHAAAVDGRQFRHVHRWAQGTQVQDAVRILRTHPRAASGAAGELEAALTAHPERRDIAQQLTARALSALFSVHIREACTPNRSDALTLDSFVNEGGTLYLVGEAIEDPKSHPGAMPLLTALASSVVERGRIMAERSSAGRLDPPLTLVLEDVAAVAPLPQLPSLLATGQDRGLPTLALLRSDEQAKSRWPHDDLSLGG